MQKITPFLWLDNQAEAAASFYVSIFRDSKILSVQRYGEEGAEEAWRPQGSVMTVNFQLNGQSDAGHAANEADRHRRVGVTER